MIPAWTGTTVRDVERPFLDAGDGDLLMARAARGLALACVRVLRAERGRVTGARVVVLAGTGNNGGDALWAAAELRRRGAAVQVIAARDRLHPAGHEALRAAGGSVETLADLGTDAATDRCLAADLLLDGLLGTGATGGLRGQAGELVERVNRELDAATDDGGQGPVVVAVDLPSGVEADTGASPGPVLAAARTVTFGGTKAAHVLPPGRGLSGEVELVTIGIEDSLPCPAVVALEDGDLDILWPRPVTEDHKYTRGVVGVVAGSPEYPGAAVLCTRSAVAAGAGMVRYLGDEHTRTLVTLTTPEVVSSADSPDGVHVQSWVAGPGAVDDEQRRRLEQILTAPEPSVLDAGAIAAVGQHLGDARLSAHQVLTPHAGELVDLLTWCQAWGLAAEVPERCEVEDAPGRWAKVAADATGATVLLKGAVTVVAGPRAETILTVGNSSPWLAAAGSGDCLAGIMGAVLANVAGRPEAFDRRVRRWLADAPLAETARNALRERFKGEGRWALVVALAATLQARASWIDGDGPGASTPERIRRALTANVTIPSA